MKWNLYAEPDVYLSDDKYNLKAKCIQDAPETWLKQTYSTLLPEYAVISKRDGKGMELGKRRKIIQESSIVEVQSGCAKGYYETELLNKVLQKTSKLYLAQDDGKLFIQNKNWIFFITASMFDKVSFEANV